MLPLYQLVSHYTTQRRWFDTQAENPSTRDRQPAGYHKTQSVERSSQAHTGSQDANQRMSDLQPHQVQTNQTLFVR